MSRRYLDLLLDTNFLIYLTNTDDKFHQTARIAFENLASQGVRMWMTSQNVIEFWAVMTKPKTNNGIGLSSGQVELQLRFLEEEIGLLSDSVAVHARWREIVRDYGVTGRQVYDAKLVAAMNVHGIVAIVTKNGRDFARYSSIRTIDPGNLNRPGT